MVWVEMIFDPLPFRRRLRLAWQVVRYGFPRRPQSCDPQISHDGTVYQCTMTDTVTGGE